MEREILSPNRKALKINLNPSIYGCFAEIGGGQEVARHFFQAGGASGTVAKTISAYDKAFSDALYESVKTGRYVSEYRLAEMLQAEYTELTRILGGKRGISTQFFSFANTIETLNFQKNNRGQGWIGLRFQLKPETDPNQVILHVNLLENDGLMQQSTLGILGVNLMYACFFLHQYPSQFLRSLLDNLSTDRLEITMIRMSGPDLDYVDNRLLSVQLVKNGMAKAIMFDRQGDVQQPYDMLYKKNVLAFRGSFRPVTYVMSDMLRTSYRIFKRDEDYDKENTISLCEMTLSNLMQEGELDEQDFLDRVDILNGMGQNVMVSNFKEYYKLVQYFSQFKIIKLRIIIGIPTLMNFFEKKYYTHLRGGVLEAMGKFFIENMKLYVYPTISSVTIDDPTKGEDLITSKNLLLADDIHDLYQFLVKNRMIIDITNAKKEWLWINSQIVIKMIKDKIPGWEEMVPKYIEKAIKKKKLFGYEEQ
ncbi:MAG: hypothetical protein M0Q51_01655 [Bacteroidales bacterium]|nr:hypothetical protein [Bacteroidales bacterium]